MMRVRVVGKTGVVEERVSVGPAFLVRHRLWNEGPRLAALFAAAGHGAWATHSVDNGGADPDLWVLADAPRAAVLGLGMRARVADQVARGRARLLLLGGCLAFGGQDGAGGWGDDPLLPVTSEGDDTVERTGGVRACGAFAPPWTAWGHNRLDPRPGATVIVRFDDGDPALIGEGARLAFASDLLPHWDPGADAAGEVSSWIARLLGAWTEGALWPSG